MSHTIEILIVTVIVATAAAYIGWQVWQLVHNTGCSCRSKACATPQTTPKNVQTPLTVAGKTVK